VSPRANCHPEGFQKSPLFFTSQPEVSDAGFWSKPKVGIFTKYPFSLLNTGESGGARLLGYARLLSARARAASTFFFFYTPPSTFFFSKCFLIIISTTNKKNNPEKSLPFTKCRIFARHDPFSKGCLQL
jgi:hypothetical protein